MILKKFNLLFRLISIIVILCMMSACANNGGKPNIETPVVEETDAITALIEDLNNDAAEDRAAAVKALGVINNPETYNYIITALTDEQEIVRDQAKQTIRTLGTRVIDPLIFMLDTNDNELRQELMAILEEIGPPAYPSLIKALSNQNEKIKSSVYEIMVNLGEPIIQDLINSFSVEDEERNYLIREILVEFDKTSINYLVDSLSDPKCVVRGMAANTLGYLKETDWILSSIEVLKYDEDCDIWWAYSDALENIDNPPVEKLVTIYREGDETLKDMINSTLRYFYETQEDEILDQARDVCSSVNEVTTYPIEYMVKPGDSFADIAATYNVSVESIFYINNLSENYELLEGDILWIPQPTETGSTQAKVTFSEGEIHPYVIFDSESDELIHTDAIPLDWLPYTTDQLQVVICLNRMEPRVIEVCEYLKTGTTQFAGSKTRYQMRMDATLMELITLNEIDRSTLVGWTPNECPQETSSFNDIYGHDVGVSQLSNWLSDFNILLVDSSD